MPEYKRTNGGKKSKKPNKFLSFLRLFTFWLVVLAFISLIFSGSAGFNAVETEEKSLSEVLQLAKDEKIEKIVVQGDTLTVTPKEGSDMKTITSRKDSYSSLYEQGFAEVIDENKVSVEVVEDIDIVSILINVGSILLPIIILGGFLIYMLRQAPSTGEYLA